MNAFKTLINRNLHCLYGATLVLLAALPAAAQVQQPQAQRTDLPEKVFTVTEIQPQFPGGEDSLKVYLEKNLQNTSKRRKKNKAETVSTTFIINEKGRIQDIKIVESSDKSLNAEAIRVIENMPAWIPAKQRGRAVAFHYKLPIQFPKRME